MQFQLTKQAKIDLLNIGKYTQNQWGIKKRNEYLDIIGCKFSVLAESPNLGRSAEHIRNGYRCYNVEKHVIFYQIKSGIVLIVRILHQSMDMPTQLRH